MAPKNRVIIDTDPGVDDVLAILYALASKSSDLEVVMLSLTHGNVDVRSCLRNVVAVFHVLEKELAWRREKNLPEGFEGIRHFKPIVAIGAEEPLQDQIESDFFHGVDGLGGIHASHPHHFTPEEEWAHLFEEPPPNPDLTRLAESTSAGGTDLQNPTQSFTPSLLPAHGEILRILRENEPDTITLVSIGPLTNFALAAAEDPETFLRCKEVVSMGGTVVDLVGNVTPVAEFNVYADPYAAARVYALTSPNPASTMPPPAKTDAPSALLPPYPTSLSRTLKLRLMALDLTEHHMLSRRQLTQAASELAAAGSPLAQWMMSFMTPMLDKMERLHLGHEGDGAALALHDPMCLWWVTTQTHPGWVASEKSPEDVRIETQGQWTRGMTVGDRRARRRRGSDGERSYDRDNWLGNSSGNRVFRMVKSPGVDLAAVEFLDTILGVKDK
ncbi:hypothetical protein B0A52_08500 [Exophiala mesophila]|uniref:Inosine/uridine-preferring nucleoside hydrolase domain-containing protein n=1 Tax=Exophiala mesophila TaxID=212818 RepID=A0A438MY64_EXOME|nr:hypothetical protein B0A52_08500 [Exophiala mesophila]